MTDYPEDVMKAAAVAHAEFADSRCRDNLGTIIARAILAERERCAKVADARGWAASRRPVMSHDDHRHDMADEIAAAIRGGSNA